MPLLSLPKLLPLTLRDKLVSLLAVRPSFISPSSSGLSRSNGSLALDILRFSSSMYDGKAEVVGRVGPDSDPEDSGPKSNDIDLDDRYESEKGDSKASSCLSNSDGDIEAGDMDDVPRDDPEALLEAGTVLKP